MNLIRKLAWTLLLGTSGVVATSSQGLAVPQQRDAAGASGDCWLFEEAPDDPFGLEDDFEGEGWSFWGD